MCFPPGGNGKEIKTKICIFSNIFFLSFFFQPEKLEKNVEKLEGFFFLGLRLWKSGILKQKDKDRQNGKRKTAPGI